MVGDLPWVFAVRVHDEYLVGMTVAPRRERDARASYIQKRIIIPIADADIIGVARRAILRHLIV
jgi:hypothetical protein